jgi:hypothetical protein
MNSVIEKEEKISGASGDGKGASSKNKKRLVFASLAIMAVTTLFYVFGIELVTFASKWYETKTEVPTTAPTAAPTEAPTEAPTPYMQKTMPFIEALIAILVLYSAYRAVFVGNGRHGTRRALILLFPALLWYFLFFHPTHSAIKIVLIAVMLYYLDPYNNLNGKLRYSLSGNETILFSMLITLMLVFRSWIFITDFFTHVPLLEPHTVTYYKIILSFISLTAVFVGFSVSVEYYRYGTNNIRRLKNDFEGGFFPYERSPFAIFIEILRSELSRFAIVIVILAHLLLMFFYFTTLSYFLLFVLIGFLVYEKLK